MCSTLHPQKVCFCRVMWAWLRTPQATAFVSRVAMRFFLLPAIAVAVVLLLALPVRGADAPALLQVINEANDLPAGLTVTSTASAASVFHSLPAGPSGFAQVSTAAQTIKLVNASSAAVIASVDVAGGFAADSKSIIFVAGSPASVTAVLLPGAASPSDWPVQTVDVALFRVVNADLSNPLISVGTTSSNCWQCIAVERTVAAAPTLTAPFFTASVRGQRASNCPVPCSRIKFSVCRSLTTTLYG